MKFHCTQVENRRFNDIIKVKPNDGGEKRHLKVRCCNKIVELTSNEIEDSSELTMVACSNTMRSSEYKFKSMCSNQQDINENRRL